MQVGPEDVERAVFKERFRGYDQTEVDALLDRVAHTLAELRDERDALATQVAALRAAPPPSADELVGRTLAAARQSAEELLAEARHQVERERAEVVAQMERVRLAVEQLARFRDDYRARLQAIMGEQLAALERAGELPGLPPAVADVLGRLPERPAFLADAVQAGWAPADEDVAATAGDDADDEAAPAPWEAGWRDPWEPGLAAAEAGRDSDGGAGEA